MDVGQEARLIDPAETSTAGVEVNYEGKIESITDGIAVLVEHAAYSVWGHSNRCAGRRHVVEVERLKPATLAHYARDLKIGEAGEGVQLHSDSELAANIRDELMAPVHPGG